MKHMLTILRLFNNPRFSDVTIRFETAGIEFPAHQNILAHCSPPMNNVLLQNPETEVLYFNSLNGGESTYSYWRVFQYMYEGSYSLHSTETLDGIGRFRELQKCAEYWINLSEDEPELLKHSTVAFLARLLKIKSLEALALSMIRSQLQSSRPPGQLIRFIRNMYANGLPEARQLVITEAAELYLQSPTFAETVHQAGREVGDLAVDLMKVFTKK